MSDPDSFRDNKKTAASMWVTLSSQIIAATLAMLAVQGAFTTFVLDKRSPPRPFYLFAVLTGICFITSIINGGVGISRITKAGFLGDWNIKVGRGNFQRQTVFCLIGMVFFFISLISSGPTKEELQQQEVKQLKEQIRAIEVLEKRQTSVEQEINDLKSEIQRLSLKTKPGGERGINHSTEQKPAATPDSK
jgi:hypothetical protein